MPFDVVKEKTVEYIDDARQITHAEMTAMLVYDMYEYMRADGFVNKKERKQRGKKLLKRLVEGPWVRTVDVGAKWSIWYYEKDPTWKMVVAPAYEHGFACTYQFGVDASGYTTWSIDQYLDLCM